MFEFDNKASDNLMFPKLDRNILFYYDGVLLYQMKLFIAVISQTIWLFDNLRKIIQIVNSIITNFRDGRITKQLELNV